MNIMILVFLFNVTCLMSAYAQENANKPIDYKAIYRAIKNEKFDYSFRCDYVEALTEAQLEECVTSKNKTLSLAAKSELFRIKVSKLEGLLNSKKINDHTYQSVYSQYKIELYSFAEAKLNMRFDAALLDEYAWEIEDKNIRELLYFNKSKPIYDLIVNCPLPAGSVKIDQLNNFSNVQLKMLKVENNFDHSVISFELNGSAFRHKILAEDFKLHHQYYINAVKDGLHSYLMIVSLSDTYIACLDQNNVLVWHKVLKNYEGGIGGWGYCFGVIGINNDIVQINGHNASRFAYNINKVNGKVIDFFLEY